LTDILTYVQCGGADTAVVTSRQEQLHPVSSG
jgi:hypothetical protein